MEQEELLLHPEAAVVPLLCLLEVRHVRVEQLVGGGHPVHPLEAVAVGVPEPLRRLDERCLEGREDLDDGVALDGTWGVGEGGSEEGG